MNKNIKLLLIPTIILVGGMGTTLNNICYCMESLPLTQKYKHPVQAISHFTDNALIQLLRYSQLEQYEYSVFDSHYKVLLHDLAKHYSKTDALYTSGIYMIPDVKFTYVSLSKYCPSDEEYANLKSTLDNITFKRPKLIPIKPLNTEDTITLTQLWNFIQNKTNYIKVYYLRKIYEFINTENKNDEYYFKILDTISSLYNDLYSFLTDAGQYIKQYSAPNNCNKYINKYITELYKQCKNNISILEVLNKDMMSWVDFHKALTLFNIKYKKYSSEFLAKGQDLDPGLIDNILQDLRTTILDYTSTPFKQRMNEGDNITADYRKSNIEYEKACSSIFRCFQTIYTSLTSMLREWDKILMLEDYGDDKEKIILENIQCEAKDLAQKLNIEFHHTSSFFKYHKEYKDLFKDKDQNSEITCDQLLKYFTNNISKKVLQTIQNIARDVLKKKTSDYATLYGILNSNINKFVAQLEPVTKPLLNFLNTELNTNEKIKDNVILPHVRNNLRALDEKCSYIKNHEINTQKAIAPYIQ